MAKKKIITLENQMDLFGEDSTNLSRGQDLQLTSISDPNNPMANLGSSIMVPTHKDLSELLSEEADPELEARMRKDPDIITEGKLKMYYRCPHLYYLETEVGMGKLPISAFAALVLHFQQKRKELLNMRDRSIRVKGQPYHGVPKESRLFAEGRLFPVQYRAGTDWKHAMDMNADELREHLAVDSPESFGGTLWHKWFNFHALPERFHKRQIVWWYKGHQGSSAMDLKNAGENYYKFILENGVPIHNVLNRFLRFEYAGYSLLAKFVEVRKGLKIDDITLWNFNADTPFDDVHTKKKNDLQTSSLVTMRILAYMQLAMDYPAFAHIFGLEPERIKEWKEQAKKGHYIDPEITYRHFEATTGNVSTTNRKSEDVDRFLNLLQSYRDSITRRDFEPNPRYCGICSKNVRLYNGKPACDEINPKVTPWMPAAFFDVSKSKDPDKKKPFSIQVIEDAGQGYTLRAYINFKEIDTLVATYTLRFESGQQDEGSPQEMTVKSEFSSRYRGIGYEKRILVQAKELLTEEAAKRGISLQHIIEFSRDFEFARSSTIRDKLVQIGYVPQQGGARYTKTYTPEVGKKARVRK